MSRPSPRAHIYLEGGGMVTGTHDKLMAQRLMVDEWLDHHGCRDDAIAAQGWQAPQGSAWVAIAFRLQRPKGHYGTGRNAGLVKDSAPARPAVKPDIDKLVRSTLDALTEAGAVRDDAQVVSLSTSKFYADTDLPGATVEVWSHE